MKSFIGCCINGGLVGFLGGPITEPKYWLCLLLVLIGNTLIQFDSE